MKIIVSLVILLVFTIGSCLPKKAIAPGSSGVNTSRSNIKNNIEEKDTTSVEKKENEKKVEKK